MAANFATFHPNPLGIKLPAPWGTERAVSHEPVKGQRPAGGDLFGSGEARRCLLDARLTSRDACCTRGTALPG